MSAYQTVVVGTDGSDSSLRAVDRAGQIAARSTAKLVIATAYFPQSEDQRAADVLKDEGYKMSGNAPIYAILREARERAKAAGAPDIEEKAVVGAPVDALGRSSGSPGRVPSRLPGGPGSSKCLAEGFAGGWDGVQGLVGPPLS